MTFVLVSYQIDTSNSAQGDVILHELQQRLGPFGAIPLNGHFLMVNPQGPHGGIDDIGDALDAVAGKYLHSFYYSAAVVPANNPDMIGFFPPGTDLAAARRMSGDPRNPILRSPAGRPGTRTFALALPNANALPAVPEPTNPGQKKEARKRRARKGKL